MLKWILIWNSMILAVGFMKRFFNNTINLYFIASWFWVFCIIYSHFRDVETLSISPCEPNKPPCQNNASFTSLPGHGPELQACVSFLGPTQSEPLLLGGGLVQLRKRIWLPTPQVELHCSQGPQFVKPPSTIKGQEGIFTAAQTLVLQTGKDKNNKVDLRFWANTEKAIFCK